MTTRDGNKQPAPAAAHADHPGVVMPPPLVYAGGLVAGALIDQFMPIPLVDAPARWIVAGVLILIGLILASGGTTRFRRAGTAVQPYKPSTTVVTDGVYQFSRNPIYLGLTAFYLGLAFAVNSGWVILLLPLVLVVMHYGVIRREERYLEGKFDAAYRDYKVRVRRWL